MSPDRHPAVELTGAEGYLVATVDDGKANALTFELIDEMRGTIAEATERSRPLVLTGRDGCFSAGFDLTVMNSGDEKLASSLFSAGGVLYRELIEAPVPIVASCTGHALAGGALLLLCADYRIGRTGSYRIGFNEVPIGMALPSFAIAVAEPPARASIPHSGPRVRRGGLARARGGDGHARRAGRRPALPSLFVG